MPFVPQAEPERARRSADRVVPRQDELGAHLDDGAVLELPRPHPAADPVARLETRSPSTPAASERVGRSEPGEARLRRRRRARLASSCSRRARTRHARPRSSGRDRPDAGSRATITASASAASSPAERPDLLAQGDARVADPLDGAADDDRRRRPGSARGGKLIATRASTKSQGSPTPSSDLLGELVAALLEVRRVDGVVDVPVGVDVAPSDLDPLLVHASIVFGRTSAVGVVARRNRTPEPLSIVPCRTALDFTVRTQVESMQPMAHPQDRSGMSRRRLLQGCGGRGAGYRRARTARRLREHDDADRRLRGWRRLVEPRRRRSRPARAACRCRAPTTPSPGRSRTTTSRSPTASPTRTGRSAIYNYADYLDPGLIKKFEKLTGRKVQVATYNSSDEAIAKLASGAVALRRDHRPLGLEHRQPDRPAAAPAAQPLVPAQLREEHLAGAAGPVLRPRQPLHGAVRRLVGRDRLAQRQDRAGHRRDATSPGTSSGSRSRTRARSRSSTTSGTRSRCRCSATRCAPAGGPTSTPRTQKVVAQAGKDLGQLTDIANVKVAITDYQTLPEGKTWLHQSWSGDLLGAAFYYMPKGVPPSVLSYWGPDQNGVVQNDFFCIGRTAKNPALAHRFIDFMLDEKIAYENFVNYVGYTPPQKNIDAELLIKKGLIPKSLTRCRRSPRSVPAQPGAAPAERRGGAVLGRGLVEVQGRLSDGLALDLAAARASGRRSGSRSSSCSRSTPSSPSRSATRTRSPSRSRSGTRSTGTSATCSRRSRTSGTASSS